jgi:hypothetical protein
MRCVVENIDKIFGIMRKAWEIVVKVCVIDGRIHTLSEYLQENLQSNKNFYKNAVNTSMARISKKDEFVRKKREIPYKSKLKQIQARWLGRINTLRKLSATCVSFMEKKSVIFKIS